MWISVNEFFRHLQYFLQYHLCLFQVSKI
jgi:hypothetical protein